LGELLSERDIAGECFTGLGGTENRYIARAFRRRGYSVVYRIEDGFPSNLNPPAIAGVRIGGIGHFIAIMDHVNGMYITGDPLAGREEIPDNKIATKYDFTGFFMEIDKPR
jgi:hypothetical protein